LIEFLTLTLTLTNMYAPKYTITNQILKNIGLIEAAREVTENAPLVPLYEKQFQTDAITRTVYHGTHIEGNELSYDQTKKIMEGEQVVAHERDVQEVINYRNVTQLLDDLVAKRGGYDLASLLDIHRETVNKLVAPEKTGTLRVTEVVIREEGSGNIILQPPPHIEVPYLLDDFFEWFNSEEGREVHPILRAGIAHYVLVAIHPFVEGNGRTTRAFANLVLMKEGYNIKRFFALEEHFDNDLGAYYDAFAKVDSQSEHIAERDLTIWLTYFTYVVAIELTKIKEKVRKISIDMRLKGRIGQQVALSERQMKLVEYMSSQGGGAGMQDLKKVIPMVSEDTVLRDLRQLMEKGIIKKEGSTKASRYVLTSK
jgi:Fic family protein